MVALYAGANWVGVKDVENDDQFKFVQTGGTVPVALWSPNNPTNAEDCVLLFGNSGLRVAPCNTGNTYACEAYLN